MASDSQKVMIPAIGSRVLHDGLVLALQRVVLLLDLAQQITVLSCRHASDCPPFACRCQGGLTEGRTERKRPSRGVSSSSSGATRSGLRDVDLLARLPSHKRENKSSRSSHPGSYGQPCASSKQRSVQPAASSPGVLASRRVPGREEGGSQSSAALVRGWLHDAASQPSEP